MTDKADELFPDPDELYDVVSDLVARGFLAFPLKPGTKVPMTKNGFKDASADLEGIATWTHAAGHPNAGLVYPPGSVIVFLWDLDGGDGHTTWRDDWKRLVSELGILPHTLTTVTPSGGRHIYLIWRTDLYGPPPAGNHLLGFTVRWPGMGYVVAPGSVVDGKLYATNLAPIADFPQAWARAAVAAAESRTETIVVRGEGFELPQSIPAGGRYDAILRYSASLYNRKLAEREVWSLIRSELAPRFSVPLSNEELAERFNRAWAGIEHRLGEPRTGTRDNGATPTSPDLADEALPELGSGGFPAAPDPIAFTGYLGACVEAVLPATSASRVGLLASMLSICGAVLATTTRYHGRQTSSFMTLLVGESGVGRKGTAMNAAWEALTAGDAFGDQYDVRLKGVGSGEAVVGAMAARAKYGFARGLLVVPELASLFKAIQREGSTLSPTIRDAWDHVELSNITRTTGTLNVSPSLYQLGALAAVTPRELRELLEGGTELMNGFVNRWLPIAVVGRDVRVIHDEARIPAFLAALLAAALERAEAARHQPILLSDAAWDRLDAYHGWLMRQPGDITLLVRYAAIACRIALVHTSIELDDEVPVDHVERAIALTEYARAGLEWVYGPLTSAKAQEIMRWLASKGTMTRSELCNAMYGHRSDSRLQPVIDEVVRSGRATWSDGPSTGGRPTKVLTLVGPSGLWATFGHGEVSPPSEHETRPLVSRVRARGEDAATETSAESSPDQPKVGPKVVPTHPEGLPFPPNDPPEHTVVPAQDVGWRWPCHFYVDHRSHHLLVAGQWECDICRPVAVQ